MKALAANQRGVTFITLVIILALIGFFALLILKIGPIYMDHFKVESSLTSLENEPGITEKNRHEIMTMLMNRLDINMIDSVGKDDIHIVQEPGYLKVNVAYEVTRNIAGNLDVLVYFDDSIEVGAH